MVNRMKIGIIGAMKSEMDAIKSHVEGPEVKTIGGVDFIEGKLKGVSVVVATSGIGKVAAGICAQSMILEYKPDTIINIGVAGSLTPELNIGDIAVATAVVQHDMDTTGLGDPIGFISGLAIVEIPSSRDAADALARTATELGFKNRQGVIATGDIFVTSTEKKKSIIDSFGSIACEMEGAGVGQACYVNGVPFCVLRAISDNGDENVHQDYHMSLEMAADRATQVMENYLEGLWRDGTISYMSSDS